MQQREKVRVYILARELNIDTADLLRLCKQVGYDVKNQLSSLDHDQQIKLEEMVKKAPKPGTPPPATGKPPIKPVSLEEKPVPNLGTRPAKREAEPARTAPPPIPEEPAVPATPVVVPAAAAIQQTPVAATAPTPAPVVPIVAEAPAAIVPTPPKPTTPSVIKEKVIPVLTPTKPTASSPSAAKRTPPPSPTAPAATVTPPPLAPAPPPVSAAPPTPPVIPPAPAETVAPVAKQEPAPPKPPTPQPPKMEPPRPTVLPNIPSGKVANLPTGQRAPLPDLNKRTPAAAARDTAGGAGKQPTPPPSTPGKRPDQGPPKKPSALPSHLQNLKPVPTPQLKQPAKQQPPKGEKIIQPLKTFTQEQLTAGKTLTIQDLLRPPPEPVVEEPIDDDERDKKKKPGEKKAIPGRNERKEKRTQEALQRKSQRDLIALVGKEDEEQKGRTLTRRRQEKQKTVIKQRATHLELEPPFTVRSLSEDLGIRSVELMFKLREHGAAPNITINSIIDSDMAQMLALDFKCELVVLTPQTDEDKILEGFNPPDKPEDLVLRAPVVTVMGHVDHGKTSLLDKIRRSNVAATEAGGITQVIRAWRVEHNGHPITFLDTPGHEAFTKMRARGANVTDIAVIVVAADDGVMPQTEEAIAHAKAAGVSIVVAINKVDLPSANLNRTRQQLYGLNVLPDNMGGDTPFVETSAATGKGIDELLDTLALVAELKELKSNPNKHARGTCLEAMLSEDEGVRATLLVRDGTLRKGDVILCGATSGRVRQMYNDLGQPIQEAGPSVPVRITGLDAVPEAGDTFNVVPDLIVAKDIAERREQKMRESSGTKRPTITWERLTEAKIEELKIILKADFRGSIEAIRKELDKLQHAEVRVRILEAGIGGITENDVWLALASPEDTMIVGFNSVPDDGAKALAEERDVQIREYNIIYNLTSDIRAALEGKLKPREEIVHLGRAIVRDTFKISRVGTIGGCYVTQGNIKRNAKVRVIRDGIVIFPPPDRTVGLDSLKRFKEDVGEVREGFECGIKVAGYDDIKAGDVIEAYRVEQVQRTLE